MNTQEAIKALNEIPVSALSSENIKEAIKEATKALELTTAKACEIKTNLCYCPKCHSFFGSYKTIKANQLWDMKHCKFCGQAIDWKLTIDNLLLPKLK